jgi:hypothetical protein
MSNPPLMEVKLWFKSKPEYHRLLDILMREFEVPDRAFAFSVAVNLNNGDMTCHIHYPSPEYKK